MVIFCIFFIPSSGKAKNLLQMFSLKVSGGYGNTTGGDFGNLISGMNSQFADIATLYGATVTDELKNVGWGPEFESELIFKPYPNIGIGLSVGYMKRRVKSRGEMKIGSWARTSLSWEPTYTAVPVKLSGTYYLQMAPKITAYLTAGIGYYLAKIDYTTRVEHQLYNVLQWEQDEGQLKDHGFGFHGGVGFEYPLVKNIALYAQGLWRSTHLNDWKASSTHREDWGTQVDSGTFWFVEQWNQETGKYYPTVLVSDTRPSGQTLRNVKKADIGYSGIIFGAGLKFTF